MGFNQRAREHRPGPAEDNAENGPTVEALLCRQLRYYATELRRLAYALPHGVGEHALLRLSEHIAATAEQPPGIAP